MNHRHYGPELADSYNRQAPEYRRDDEIEARSENHHRIGGNLRRICRSFGHSIRVLEIGCGTGRYFHWLENVSLLVGTDLSAEMLKQARHPVRAEEVTAGEIRLLPGNIYEMQFEAGSFDFIYSLGVFGYGAALTPELCATLHRWLAPSGRLYIDAIEVPSEKRMTRVKRAVKQKVLPFLPASTRARIESRKTGVPVIRHTRRDVEGAMESAGFHDFSISSNYSHTPLWKGVHLECIARKGSAVVPERVRRAAEFAAVDYGPP